MTAIDLEARRKFIGASESSVLLGVSNYPKIYKTAHDLFLQKTGQKQPESIGSKNAHYIFWGHMLEASIIDAVPMLYPDQYSDVSGKLECHWLDPYVDGMACSPDAIVRSAEDDSIGVLEAKTTSNPRILPSDNTCPPAWYCQVQHQLAASDSVPGLGGLKWGIVACLLRGSDFRVFRLERDEEMISRIRNAVKDFWKKVRAWEDELPDPTLDMYRADPGEMHCEPATMGDGQSVEGTEA